MFWFYSRPIKFAIYANGKMLRDFFVENKHFEQFEMFLGCPVFSRSHNLSMSANNKKRNASLNHKILVMRVPPDAPSLSAIATMNWFVLLLEYLSRASNKHPNQRDLPASFR